MKNKPLLIVLTPVFNEAWILPAFLKATSLWADNIIIADQMSTDGSRELYKQYPKVTVIDNPRKEMHMAATRRLLFEEAEKIEGDKILFALDADEFLSGNFVETEGWKTILNSEPGDVFEFRWMNLSADATQYTTWLPYCWAAHWNVNFLNGHFPDNFIHEWRFPWPNDLKHEYIIDDISFIHFARVNVARQRNKERFYQVSQSAPLHWYSGVSFWRPYHQVKEEQLLYPVPVNAYAFYEAHGMHIKSLMNLADDGAHYTNSVFQKFDEKGIDFFRKLDIWDEEFIQKHNIKDPRRPVDRIMNFYLRKTNTKTDKFIVRAIDKILKKIY